MALNLRKAVVRNAVVNSTICFALSIALGLLSDAIDFNGANLAWPAALSIGIGLFTGWQTTARIKSGVMQSIAQAISYMPLVREPHSGNDRPDWETLDDYAAQLQTRGFSKMGEYTLYPSPRHFSCVAACFIDASESMIVEVQQMQIAAAHAPGAEPDLRGVHFSICSVMGGKIRVVTTDHTATASNFLIRGDHEVVACHPGTGLLALLGKHERLLGALHQRTGKSPNTGLTMERHILIQRESFEQARRRLERMSGYDIAKQIDAFEAHPLRKWAPPSIRLASLPERTLADLDAGLNAHPQAPIIGTPAPAFATARNPESIDNPGSEPPVAVAGAAGANHRQIDALRERIASGANWFYWIAALSLVNIVTGMMGSDWGFAVGLGISQLLSGIAGELHGAAASFATVGLLYAASLAITIFFAACGWSSRRPSAVAFVVGMAAFSVDSLIFLLASDWIGVAFHGLALFFLWNGFSAARELRKLMTA